MEQLRKKALNCLFLRNFLILEKLKVVWKAFLAKKYFFDKISYLDSVKSVIKCIRLRVVHVCEGNSNVRTLLNLNWTSFTSTISLTTDLSCSTFTTHNDRLVPCFKISFQVAEGFLANSKNMRRVFLHCKENRQKKFS